MSSEIDTVTKTIVEQVDHRKKFLDAIEESGYGTVEVARELSDMLNKDKDARDTIKEKVLNNETVSGDVEIDLLKPSTKLQILKLIIKASGVTRSLSKKLSLNQFNSQGGEMNFGEEEAQEIREALRRKSERD